MLLCLTMVLWGAEALLSYSMIVKKNHDNVVKGGGIVSKDPYAYRKQIVNGMLWVRVCVCELGVLVDVIDSFICME